MTISIQQVSKPQQLYIFSTHLCTQIQSNVRYNNCILNCSLFGVDDFACFHNLYSSANTQDITPHLHASAATKVALKLLNTVIVVLGKNVCPQDNLTRKERFCWGVVTTFCDRIQPQQDSFQWMEPFTAIIEKMGELYHLYCQTQHIKRGAEQSITQERVKLAIRRCSPDAVKYYEWVREVHKFLSDWKKKIMLQDVTHDDIVNYESSRTSLCKVAKALCAAGMIIEPQYIAEIRRNYLQDFEKLNLLLIKYVPEVPRVRW